MNRTLVSLLAAAAVVGATGGTVAAVSLTGSDPSPTAERRGPADTGTSSAPQAPGTMPTSTTSASGTPSDPATASAGPGEPGEVLWVNRRTLHDGGTEVRLDLDDDPASVERAAGGWVVTTKASTQEPSYEAVFVRPDGTRQPLGSTFGDGDVSPDGTRYVAMHLDDFGYAVWDVESGEVVDEVDEGAATGQYPVGGAQFVGDDAVASTWSSNRGPTMVLLARLASAPDDPDYDESTETTVVSDDVVGEWAISPDGRWFAGTSRTAKDAETGSSACASIAPVLGPADSPAEPVTDCGSTFSGVPSFSDDSSAVLALPSDTDGFGPGVLRPLSTDGFSKPGEIDLPDSSLDGVYLRDGLVAVLGADNLDGDGTRIAVCSTTGCEQVASAGDAAGTAVLGTQV